MSNEKMEKNNMRLKNRNNENKFPLLKMDIFQNTLNRINAGKIGCHVIIPHVCNNINIFGGGFTKDLSERYPMVKENFHLLGNSAKLGKVQYIEVEKNQTYGYKLIIANMIAQDGTINTKNPRPLNYAALAFCMTDVRNYCYSLVNNLESSTLEIHAPKFGSGLSGGDWTFIQELIVDTWKKYKTFIYIK
jgi:hypothetical protein